VDIDGSKREFENYFRGWEEKLFETAGFLIPVYQDPTGK
jgi:hypothetical protein